MKKDEDAGLMAEFVVGVAGAHVARRPSA